jgi:uncharacterized protein with NAD-binding domain and iron-sulfur cluster
MSKRRIAILGGGLGGLVAAYELSKTDELRAAFDVTVHQLGWRLGGKCASARDEQKGMRIEEHGLHVWFGFYQNAFAMIRDVYAHKPSDPDDPLRTWRDALKPLSFTPIGEESADGKWSYWGVTWPTNADEPGDGKLLLTPWGAVTELLSLLKIIVRGWLTDTDQEIPFGGVIDPKTHRLYLSATHPGLGATNVSDGANAVSGADGLTLDGVLHRGVEWARSFCNDPWKLGAMSLAGLADLLRLFRNALSDWAVAHPDDSILCRIWPVIDMGIATVCGILNPKYGILETLDLEVIDDYELRAWLMENGATQASVDASPLRALYDTGFFYENGSFKKPNLAAGTAVRAILRIVATYKEAVLFLMQTGMGECVIAPIYRLLLSRGVKFELFHKVAALRPTPDGALVGEVDIDVQAEPLAGSSYDPIKKTTNGLWYWPSEPFWDQLQAPEGGWPEPKPNFESHWCQQKPARRRTLTLGTDFDEVVLAMSVGAFKKLNEQPTMLDALYPHSPPLAEMADALGIVPTQAIQLWVDKDRLALGWCAPKPAAVAIPELFDVWGDMSQQRKFEGWPAPGPAGNHYFCGIYPTDLFKAPTTDASVPERARKAVLAAADQWLQSYAQTFWPDGVAPGKTTGLDYGILHAPAALTGLERLDYQWIRANVDPTECCVGSLAGTTKKRLAAHESGFSNLILAGDWAATGMNTACVEGAVMGGMAASRAISGSPQQIVGEDFFRRPHLPPRHTVSKPGGGPVYVSDHGHGEQCALPPGIMKGGRCSYFMFDIDHEAAQRFVDAQLNAPTNGKLRYAVLGNTAMLSFLKCERFYAGGEPIGWLPDGECAFWLPLLAHGEGILPRLTFWMPYIFIDSCSGMVTGREVWGFRKEIGSVTAPSLAAPVSPFIATATIFETLAYDTPGKVAPLVQVSRTPGAPSPPWSDGASGWKRIVHELTRGVGLLVAGAVDASLDVAAHLLEPKIPLVNLKQFRDAEDPTRACYQAIVEGPCVLKSVYGGGFYEGSSTLELIACQSHPIAADLGLSGNVVQARFGFWVDMDFDAVNGKVVWSAHG